MTIRARLASIAELLSWLLGDLAQYLDEDEADMACARAYSVRVERSQRASDDD